MTITITVTPRVVVRLSAGRRPTPRRRSRIRSARWTTIPRKRSVMPGGEEFHFCSAGCRTKFLVHPERYERPNYRRSW